MYIYLYRLAFVNVLLFICHEYANSTKESANNNFVLFLMKRYKYTIIINIHVNFIAFELLKHWFYVISITYCH